VGEVAVRAGTSGAAAIAAATPFRRADALRQLREGMSLRTKADGATIERAVALDKLRSRCTDAIDDLFEHHRLEASLYMAAQCNDPWREGRAWFALAKFERAAAAYARGRERDPRLPYSLSEATAYLAWNKWDRAAEALHALSKSGDEGPDSRDRLECAAAYAEERGGKAEALKTLLARKQNSSSVCTLLSVEIAAAHDLVGHDEYQRHYWGQSATMDLRMTGRALGIEKSWSLEHLSFPRRGTVVSPGQLLFDPRRDVDTVPPALAEAAAARLESLDNPAASLERSGLLMQLAAFESYLGEVGEAEKRLEQVELALKKARGRYTDAQIDDFQRWWWDWPRVYAEEEGARHVVSDEQRVAVVARDDLEMLALTRYALAIRAGTSGVDAPMVRSDRAGLVSELTTSRLAKIDGDAASLARLAQRDQRDANRRLWDLVLAQDGAELVLRLEDKGVDGRGVVDFLAAQTPLHGELARWVRWNYAVACTTCGIYPLANQVASRRDAAAAAHATDVEAATAEIARRLRVFLLNRETAVVLAVVSDLSPP
jgi:hypothetical protein